MHNHCLWMFQKWSSSQLEPGLIRSSTVLSMYIALWPLQPLQLLHCNCQCWSICWPNRATVIHCRILGTTWYNHVVCSTCLPVRQQTHMIKDNGKLGTFSFEPCLSEVDNPQMNSKPESYSNTDTVCTVLSYVSCKMFFVPFAQTSAYLLFWFDGIFYFRRVPYVRIQYTFACSWYVLYVFSICCTCTLPLSITKYSKFEYIYIHIIYICMPANPVACALEFELPKN